jgi:glycosyltransferase involved in cell wall biosynthesis
MRLGLVTPVLNGMPYLPACVESVLAQGDEVEYVVQDGGSTDGSCEYLAQRLKGTRARWFSESDLGIYDAVLRGFARLDTPVMGWLGADDLLTPWAARTLLRTFEATPGVQWLCGIPAKHYWRDGAVAVRRAAGVHARTLIRMGWYHPGRLGCLMQETMFWRKSLWVGARGEDVLRRYRLAADFHLWREFARHTSLISVSSVLGIFGVRAGQVSERLRSEYLNEVGSQSAVERLVPWALIYHTSSMLLQRRLIVPGLEDRQR